MDMEESVIFDIEQIKKLLPHRYPFLLVDRVVKLVKGDRITAIKNVTANEPFFQGHFPQRAVMPGVLIMEALAQTAALLARASVEESLVNSASVLFVGADEFKWKRMVVPGDARGDLHPSTQADAGRRGRCQG
jgi:3-hydroxyacyl-[acyl-carrier-protein] dehydratase